MTEISAPLVGAHFRPPAEIVLKYLPAGATLSLDPEPENPYDEQAVRVLVSPSELPLPIDLELETDLPNFGTDVEELLQLEEIWLGYIAASGGKPLAKLQQRYPELVGNGEVLAALTQPDARATLAFASGGEPLVRVTVPSPSAGSSAGQVP